MNRWLVVVVLTACMGLATEAASTKRVPAGRNAQGHRLFRNVKDGTLLILVPAGPFVMGHDAGPSPPSRHIVRLPAYLIGRDEVTNGQFARFEAETGYRAKGRWRDYFEAGREAHPVVHVLWDDACAYCAWSGLRLPTEAEWEKAARGTDGRRYPWGERWNPGLCNTLGLRDRRLVSRMLVMDQRRGTLPVRTFPGGASPCGAFDMLGNALEWCAPSGRESPWPAPRPTGRPPAGEPKVLRGGGWNSAPGDVATWTRDKAPADYLYFFQYAGFRAAADP